MVPRYAQKIAHTSRVYIFIPFKFLGAIEPGAATDGIFEPIDPSQAHHVTGFHKSVILPNPQPELIFVRTLCVKNGERVEVILREGFEVAKLFLAQYIVADEIL